MPLTPSIYFLDGTSLSNSTSVFLNSEQTLCAPEGFYSDGNVIRQLSNCILLPAMPCSSYPCFPPCGQDITYSGNKGVFIMDIDVGNTIGAVIIQFSSGNAPDGIIAEWNGNYYNELTRPVGGYCAAPSGLPTYVGKINSGCGLSGLVGSSPYTNVPILEWNGTTFVPTTPPSTQTVTVLASQAFLTPTEPSPPGPPVSKCIMVVPKTSASPSNIKVTVFAPCEGTAWNIGLGCATNLNSFLASTKQTNIGPGYCNVSNNTNTYYSASTVPGQYPYISIHDWVFTDAIGQNKLPDGFYKTAYLTGGVNDTIEVATGVVIAITNECP
jgi:hypothetical protein